MYAIMSLPMAVPIKLIFVIMLFPFLDVAPSPLNSNKSQYCFVSFCAYISCLRWILNLKVTEPYKNVCFNIDEMLIELYRCIKHHQKLEYEAQ